VLIEEVELRLAFVTIKVVVVVIERAIGKLL
jgi:hypothetical protein